MKTDEKQNINTCTIFYSWQSDDKRARNYIEKSLKEAVNYINNTAKNQTVISIDRDTKGKLGSPNIPKTIEEKISLCDIFIADLTVTHDFGGKRQINQNVMYECGYALSEVGDKYCILLHDQDSCEPKDLPFDIAQRRLLTYSGKLKNLKDKLLEVIPLYIENANLHKKQSKDGSHDLNVWEDKILCLFGSITKEKRIVVPIAGSMYIWIVSGHDKQLEKELCNHRDPQEIRAALTNLAKNEYIEMLYLKSTDTVPSYRLLQKGYDYIRTHK